MLVGLGVIVGSVAWVSWNGMPGRVPLVIGLIGLVLTVHGSSWILRRRARLRMRAIAAGRAVEPVEAVFTAIEVDRATWVARSEFQLILSEMLRNGRRPEVVVLEGPDRKWMPHCSPLAIQFEPIPLMETDEAFKLLQTSLAAEDGSGVAEHTRRIAPATGLDILYSTGRILRLVAGPTGVLWMIMLLAFVTRSGRGLFTPSNYFQLAFSVLIVAIVLRWILRMGTQQYFLLPSGLLSRRCGVFSRRWTRHLFAAGRSVLWLNCVGEGQGIEVFVADADMCDRFRLTPAEAEMLVRGWLSPLAPPELERLSDLA